MGLTIDSALKQLELPEEKLYALAVCAASFKQQAKITKRDLQVLIGHLSFASRAIYGSRTLARISSDAMTKVTPQNYFVRLTLILKHKLHRWEKFAKKFNGLCPCKKERKRTYIVTDAHASLSGFGAVQADGRWVRP